MFRINVNRLFQLLLKRVHMWLVLHWFVAWVNSFVRLVTQATCYTYPGCLIPDIRGRIPHVLSNNSMPDRIVLQCVGNDAEKYYSELVLVEFKNLITDIKPMCPDSNIILSSIPHRKNNFTINRNINRVNEGLRQIVKQFESVHVVDLCPHRKEFFKYDKTHFNNNGKGIKNGCPCIVEIRGTQGCASVGDILMFCPLMTLFQTYIAPFMLKSDETKAKALMLESSLMIILVIESNQIGNKNLQKYFHLTLIPVRFMNYIN